jgi:hypothetical protein
MQITSQEIQTPIYRQYVWQIDQYEDGKWKRTERVWTWTKTKSVALRHAKISSPALRGCRLRANVIGVEATPEGMTLSTHPQCEGRASYYVFDDDNETRTLQRENKRKGSAIKI